MDPSMVDKLEIDLFDDTFTIGDINFDDFDLDLMDINSSNDLTSETLIFSEETCPTYNPIENSSHDIPTDRREWMILDPNSRRERPPLLFEFLILLVQNPRYTSYASYTNKSQGIFQVHEPKKVANLWQQVKNRQSNQIMTYDKFARAIRWYYPRGIMKKTNARYTFQFSSELLNRYTIIDHNNNNNTITNDLYVNQSLKEIS